MCKFLKYDTPCRIPTTISQSEVKQNEDGTANLCIPAYSCAFQVDALERVALEVLRLVRSIKNTFAPINRIPPEVLSLIPDYFEDDTDRELIALTHVCRGWRDAFISRSPLWTNLDFTNIDKTRTYIQRSQCSPFKLYLRDDKVVDDAFALMIPHIRRLESLTIDAYKLPSVLGHFRCHTPLLEKLDVSVSASNNPVLDGTLFNGDLSSLHELRICGVITNLPWKNLTNLRVFSLESSSHKYGITQILDFLEAAPLLDTVSFRCAITGPSDGPPGRIIPLPRLRFLTIHAAPPHSTLLHHLHIPTGASLTSEFLFSGEESPLAGYLTNGSLNFGNLSHTTAINLLFESNIFAQFSGPTGSLRVLAFWLDTVPYPAECRTFHSLGPVLSTIEKLVVFKFEDPGPVELEECPIFRTLSSTSHLRTLVLTDCFYLPFIRALDPDRNPSNLVLCINMQELVLYIMCLDHSYVQHVFNMAKNRDSRGAKLWSVTIVDLTDRGPREPKEMSKLREHVTHVEYRGDDTLPPWDDIPGGSGGQSK